MDLTLHQLRMLREVALQGTIAAAATSLGYTASAVSQQLAALERATGVAPLERIGRGVRLTAAGRQLVEHADRILAQVEEAQAAVEEAAGVARGEVQLAVFESAASAFLPDIIGALRAEHPEVVLRTVNVDPDQAIDDLVTGRLDLALVYDYPHSPSPRPRGIHRTVLRHDTLRLAVPTDDPLTGAVDLATLADRAWVVAGPLNESCARCLRQACREAGYEPDVHHQIDAISASLRLVAAGAGLALVPDLAALEPPQGVRFVDLATPLHRTIELAGRQASMRRPTIRAVVDAIVDAARPAQAEVVRAVAS